MSVIPEGEELQILRDKVKPLIIRIRQEKKLRFNAIAMLIDVDRFLFYKWKDGTHFPNDYEIKEIVEKLEKLLEKPAADLKKAYAILINAPNIKESKTGYETKKYVSIFFDLNEKIKVYTGKVEPGNITLINGKPSIIAYKNDSVHNKNADGLIYVYDFGLEPALKYGSLVAIRRIDKKDWLPGTYYLIIYASNQVILRKLYKGENDETVTLVAENKTRFPDHTISLKKIEAIFKVEQVSFAP